MAIFRSRDFLRVLELKKNVDDVDSEVSKELDQIAHKSGYKDRYELLRKTDEVEASFQKIIVSINAIQQHMMKSAASLSDFPRTLQDSLAAAYKQIPPQFINDIQTMDREELFEKYPDLEIEDTLAKIEIHPEWLLELSENPGVRAFIGERLVEQLIDRRDINAQVTQIVESDDDRTQSYTLSNEEQSSLESILKACVDWVSRPSIPSITFDEFSNTRFGSENGYLNVSPNKFYRKFLPKAQELKLITKNEKGRYFLVAKNRLDAYKMIKQIVEGSNR
jgi:hypothetical protein